MKRDGVSCQCNVEVDPVVTMNIERDVHYRDLERAIEDSHERRVFCVPYLFRFKSKERARDSCVVHRVEKRAARALREKIF